MTLSSGNTESGTSSEAASGKITLQFEQARILTLLRHESVTGKEIRTLLEHQGITHLSGQFSKMMQRLCTLRLVEAEEIDRGSKGGSPQKRYMLTSLGNAEWSRFMAFLQRQIEIDAQHITESCGTRSATVVDSE